MRCLFHRNDKIGIGYRGEKMKIKRILIGILVLMMIGVGCQTESQEETRATWISYIDYTEILWGKSQSEYQAELDLMMENCKDLKINTIYVHASAFTDAYYPSKIYPTAQYITGKMGDELSFDPFAMMVDTAKKNGLRIEAWINPYRSLTVEQMKNLDADCLLKKWVDENSRAILEYNGRWYLNPASEEAKNTVVQVIEELVQNYDIDGVHMDDYFYPEGIDETFDWQEYKLHQEKSLSEFRKDNVNDLIERISKTIKKLDKNCTLSISPAGNIEYSTESIYGDVAYWIQNEWIDVVVPQIYFGFEHETLPFDACLKQWEELVKGTDVKLVVGLAAYKINTEDNYAKSGKEEWIQKSDILTRQIQEARKAINYDGFSLFSYHSIIYPEQSNAWKVSQEIESVVELVQQ